MTTASHDIRVGLGLGLHPMWYDAADFAALVTSAEDTGWDSLWFSEHLTGPTHAAFPQIAYAAALTKRMRLGTSVTVVPGRSPVELAKTLWTLNELCGGRLLPIVGLGIQESREHDSFGVRRHDRGRWMDEALPIVRSLVSGVGVEYAGDLFTVPGVAITAGDPTPLASIWMGGREVTELRRTARLADGWLASFATAESTRRSIRLIRAYAAECGRAIDDDHFGLLFAYAPDERCAQMVEQLERFHPGVDPEELCPVGPDSLRNLLEAHAVGGVSKFVLVPAYRPEHWPTEQARLRQDVRRALGASPIATVIEG